MESQQSGTKAVKTGLGVFALLLGIIGFLLAAPKMDEMKSGLGQLAMALNSHTANELQLWQFIFYASIVAVALGILMIILGAVGKSR